ncbi:MAG: hypothetical protein SFU98_02060 [Leptospiraceae bacterium]|nr:hypothetical protein [Leptospiraceae bacterium]
MKKILLSFLLFSIALSSEDTIRLPFPDDLEKQYPDKIAPPTEITEIEKALDEIHKSHEEANKKKLEQEKNDILTKPVEDSKIVPKEESVGLKDKNEKKIEPSKKKAPILIKDIIAENEKKSKDNTEPTLKPKPKKEMDKEKVSLPKKEESKPKSSVALPSKKETQLPKDQIATLPNIEPTKKKNEKEELAGIYYRANYHLNRKDEKRAYPDYTTGSSGEGATANKSKLELIRVLGNERKLSQAKSMIETIPDGDVKWEAHYEFAIALDNSARNKSDREEAINEYLYIVTEAPKDHKLQAKTNWALGLLLFKNEDYVQSLDHLSKIIQKYSDTEFYDDAIYLTGRIYEESTFVKLRDIDRAKKFYKLFLKNKDKEGFKSSHYLREVERRLKALETNS